MTKLPIPKEQDIQRSILEYLWAVRIFAWKCNNSGIKKPDGGWIPSGLKGVSDILGVLKGGRFLAIEVKRLKGRATVNQQEFIDKVNRAGGLAFVATSVDEVIEKLKGE